MWSSVCKNVPTSRSPIVKNNIGEPPTWALIFAFVLLLEIMLVFINKMKGCLCIKIIKNYIFLDL